MTALVAYVLCTTWVVLLTYLNVFVPAIGTLVGVLTLGITVHEVDDGRFGVVEHEVDVVPGCLDCSLSFWIHLWTLVVLEISTSTERILYRQG
jgi:hypothetical protein